MAGLNPLRGSPRRTPKSSKSTRGVCRFCQWNILVEMHIKNQCEGTVKNIITEKNWGKSKFQKLRGGKNTNYQLE